ncbi:MAG TPA: ankyrin repeat domain-containing protein, partial [Saprospiraceae bacterium]|nr:ankyrin repeat domain-containing protein [Saprospiraceae bacterium]
MNLRPLLLLALFSLPIMGCGPSSPGQQGSLEGKLLEAVASGNAAAVDSCLNAGADANARDAYGMPAILLAARGGYTGVAESLLQHGASANDTRLDAFGSTPLMEASAHNDTAMAQLLLANGADVLRRDTFGDPALNWAAYYGHIAYADVLLRHGAKWDVASRNGTALDIAAQQWHLELLDFFIDKGAG